MLTLAASAWASALVCVLWPSSAWWVGLGCALGALLTLGGVEVRRRRGRSGPYLGLVVLVFAAMAVTVGLSMPAREQAVDSAGRVVDITAIVSSSATVGQDGRLWFEAQASSIGPRGEERSLSVPLRVGVEPADGFDLGAEVRVVGEAAATDAGERSALMLYATEAEVVHPAAGVFGVAAGARHAFIERSSRLPEPGAGLLPGLAVGDTARSRPNSTTTCAPADSAT